jgi:hypothetical protein
MRRTGDELWSDGGLAKPDELTYSYAVGDAKRRLHGLQLGGNGVFLGKLVGLKDSPMTRATPAAESRPLGVQAAAIPKAARRRAPTAAQ